MDPICRVLSFRGGQILSIHDGQEHSFANKDGRGTGQVDQHAANTIQTYLKIEDLGRHTSRRTTAARVPPGLGAQLDIPDLETYPQPLRVWTRSPLSVHRPRFHLSLSLK